MEKQMKYLMEEVNFPIRTPKLVKCLAVHNESDWVEYNLRNCYNNFDTIRVVEGAVAGRPNSTNDGHSTDDTLEKIRNFPDPAGKIELYTRDRFFNSLEEQKQIFLNVAKEGEWLFITDCDEFYKPEDIERARKAIMLRPAASEIIPTFLHFYRDFWHVRDYHPEWNLWHQRIIRFRRGLRYHTHPVATDIEGHCTYFAPHYQLKRFLVPNLYIYHYGHAKDKSFHKMKQQFYSSELEKFRLQDGTNASQKFDEKYLEFANETENLSEVLEFDGEHPGELKEHPRYQFKHDKYIDNDKIRKYRCSDAYSQSMPTIPQMMHYSKQMQKFYNILDV